MTTSSAQDTLARVAASTEQGLAAGIVGPLLEFIVYGMPGPQGSKKLVGRDGKGRGILVESSKKVKPWREAVRYTAMEACALVTPQSEHGMGCVSGAVRVEMVFTLPKPKSAPKRKVILPRRRPDLSKLIRSTEDALTDVGSFEDDSCIVELLAAKRYPGEGVDALDRPGCVIRIWGL